MTQESPEARIRRRTFISVVLAHGLLDFYGVVWPIFKYLARLDVAVAGGLASSATIFASLTQPLFGHLAERSRPRAYMLWGTGLTFAMALLGPFALLRPHWGGWAVVAMLFALLLTRMGQAMFHPIGASVAGGYASGRRTTYISIFILAGWIGPALGQPVFSWAYHTFAGHTEILLLPGLMIFALINAWFRPGAAAAGKASQSAGTGASFAEIARAHGPGLKRRLGFLFAVLALADAVHMGVGFLLPELAEAKGCPRWAIHGGGMLIFTLGTVVTMVPLGRLADRTGPGPMMLATLLLSLVFYVLLLAWPAGWPGLTLLFLFLLGAFVGIANPLGVSYGQELIPGKTGIVSGVLMGWAWAFGGLSPMALGVLARNLGPVGALWWLGAALMAAILFTVLFLSVRPKKAA